MSIAEAETVVLSDDLVLEFLAFLSTFLLAYNKVNIDISV